MAPMVLRAENLVRRHGSLEVVRGISLELAAGDAVAITGPSGSGKTSLLHMLGLLDRPTSGTLLLRGRDPWRGDAVERSHIRLAELGFVFQQSNLLPNLSARENVALPAWRLHGRRGAALQEADALLRRFGLAERAHAPGAVLSLGEAQRVAVARALVNRPAVVLADEPTGSLDSDSAGAVLDALEELRYDGAALVVTTHDPLVTDRFPHRIVVRDGRVI